MKVLKGHGLRYLPMNSCGNIRLPIVGVCRSRIYLKDEISDLAVELVLVDISLVILPSWDIHICVNESNAGEVLGVLDC